MLSYKEGKSELKNNKVKRISVNTSYTSNYHKKINASSIIALIPSIILLLALIRYLFDLPPYSFMYVLNKLEVLEFADIIDDTLSIIKRYKDININFSSIKSILLGIKAIGDYLNRIFDIPLIIIKDILQNLFNGFQLIIAVLGLQY